MHSNQPWELIGALSLDPHLSSLSLSPHCRSNILKEEASGTVTELTVCLRPITFTHSGQYDITKINTLLSYFPSHLTHIVCGFTLFSDPGLEAYSIYQSVLLTFLSVHHVLIIWAQSTSSFSQGFHSDNYFLVVLFLSARSESLIIMQSMNLRLNLWGFVFVY